VRPGPDLIRAFCYALLIEATAVLIVVCALAIAHELDILH
jgi:hypothetical protein